MFIRIFATGPITGFVSAMLFATVISFAHAEEELIGSEEFRLNCAACHGIGGTGDGPVGALLTVKPRDLTMINRNNDGQYPFLKIFQIIDGRQSISAHGVREMPIWGDRYSAEAVEKSGMFGAEQVIRARILELVYYLQAIQQP